MYVCVCVRGGGEACPLPPVSPALSENYKKHKLNYANVANVDFEFPLEVEQYGTALSESTEKETQSSSLIKTKMKNKLQMK